MDRVFVYGTLKEGFPNFAVNHGIRVPGVFITTERYPLYLVGEGHVPWLIFQPDRGKQVSGEVFRVDESALRVMDQLERIAEPEGYRRMEIRVIDSEGLGELTVFVYMKRREQLDVAAVKLGPLSSYELQHASLYRRRMA